ncbi:MAG: protein kinase, partial [Deltaproteobacteria bacterium]|nr:protein kinase [Deltaproteobacteria bacterium]
MGTLESTERYDHVSPATEREVGASVDRFEITGVLGRGGMGVTYAARDPQLGRPVALKLVTAFSTADATERLLREARALAMVSHPNVVTMFEAGTTRGEIWIAMELVGGGT